MKRFFIIYTVLIGAAIGVFWLFGQTYTAEYQTDATIAFVVQEQQGVWDIASNLSQDDLIGSRPSFLLYSVLAGKFSAFKPGTYFLSPSFSIRDIVRVLTGGPEEVKVVLYPGMTLKEMDDYFTERGFITEGELADADVNAFKDEYPFLEDAESLEGFLMPDTYHFYPYHNVSVIVHSMLDNFQRRVGDLLEGRDDVERIVTIASLIEKEVSNTDDKPLVASVIYNRLSIDMPLQIDASVFYGACNGKFKGCQVSRDQFSNDNPYNLYLYKGLPPAPISNPTATSIQAALYSAQSNYFYYLSDPDTGATHFSETFDEHDTKRAQYINL